MYRNAWRNPMDTIHHRGQFNLICIFEPITSVKQLFSCRHEWKKGLISASFVMVVLCCKNLEICADFVVVAFIIM